MTDDEPTAAGTTGAGTTGACEASILVLGYNSLAYLDECLGAIAAAAGDHAVEVLFLNNGTDASEAFVAERYPAVRVLPSKGNVGFGQANNRLARHARGRSVILLNPDTKLYPGAIATLIETARANPDYWLLAGVVVGRDGAFETNAYPELPTYGSLLRGMVGRAGRPFAFDTSRAIQDVDVVHGGFVLCSAERWRQLGGFDESFFLYGEDIDLCRRVLDAGGRIGIVPASRVFHDLGSGNAFSPVRQRFMAAGNAQYFRRHLGPLGATTAIAMQWGTYLVRFGVGGLLGLRKPRYAAMSKGTAEVALRPWVWMRGFRSPGADPRRTPPKT